MIITKTPTDPKAGQGSSATLDAIVAGCEQWCPRCHAKITSDQLQTIFPNAPDDRVTIVRDAFNQYMENVEIIRCLRKAHIFAQIRGESGDALNPVSENLNYTRDRLEAVFGPNVYTNHPGVGAAADAGDDQAIGNALYAGANGNDAPGDGYNYRGRGYIQITGKGTYEGAQSIIKSKCAGSGIDVVTTPDDATTPKGGMISAMAYWYWKTPNLNYIADQGDGDSTVNKVTHTVRGVRREPKPNSENARIDTERRTAYQTTMQVFKTPECVDRDKPSTDAQPWIQSDALPSSNVG